MELLEKISNYAKLHPEQVAVYTDGSQTQSLTYGCLETYANRLAGYIKQTVPGDQSPIIVYGHKDPFMLVCFLACVKAGHSYCPIDCSNPQSRTEAVIKAVNPALVLTTEDSEFMHSRILSLQMISDICQDERYSICREDAVKAEDVFYIIFTSGSTGVPKGVQITYACLNSFLKWSSSLGPRASAQADGCVFLNQAPFSFDLSVMALYTSLYVGGTLWCLTKALQSDPAAMLLSMKNSNAGVWVSTPSFADICLANPDFDRQLLSELSMFFFCGEVLTNRTAKKLHQRFPGVTVLNTYGPTEATVAVTEVEITEEMCDTKDPLPVGRAKPGTKICIMDEHEQECADGQRGEITIIGDTVSSGYYNNPEVTKRSFSSSTQGGLTQRMYRTGDEGYLKAGMLHYCGRLDSQIKLHGFRIEIEDIECNIMKIPGIEKAVVVPIEKMGKIKYLVAVVVTKNTYASSFDGSQALREQMRVFVPEYMIPKKFVFVDSIPVTSNGKTDRKAVGGRLQ